MALLVITNKKYHCMRGSTQMVGNLPQTSGIGTWDEAVTGLAHIDMAYLQPNSAVTTWHTIEPNIRADGSAAPGWFRIKAGARTGVIVVDGR